MVAGINQDEKSSGRRRAGLKPALRGDVIAPDRMLTLIEAAENIFLLKGYHSATMADVAKAAGMSKKTVYQLIESKAELFALLLTHHQAQLKFPTPEPDWTIEDILCANLLCLGRSLLCKEQIAIVRLIMAEYTHSPDLGRIFHLKRVQKARSKLEICLSELTGQQGVPAKNIQDMSAMLFGMAIGEFLLSALIGFRNLPSKAALESRVRSTVRLFLTGCEIFNHP